MPNIPTRCHTGLIPCWLAQTTCPHPPVVELLVLTAMVDLLPLEASS